MELHYNVTGNERKALVKIIADVTGTKAKYMGMPTAAYDIGEITVAKDGTLVSDDCNITDILTALADAGFTAENSTAELAKSEEKENEETDEAEEPLSSPDGLNIEMPRNFFTEMALDNLQKIIDSKAALIKKALGADALPVQITDEKVSFPWFGDVDPDHVKAYTHFISALCKMAKEARRVTASEHEVDNEKYAFRCFLLRLGFIGSDYKADRKILLQNLTGSSAFKSGQKGGSDEVSE